MSEVESLGIVVLVEGFGSELVVAAPRDGVCVDLSEEQEEEEEEEGGGGMRREIGFEKWQFSKVRNSQGRGARVQVGDVVCLRKTDSKRGTGSELEVTRGRAPEKYRVVVVLRRDNTTAIGDEGLGNQDRIKEAKNIRDLAMKKFAVFRSQLDPRGASSEVSGSGRSKKFTFAELMERIPSLSSNKAPVHLKGFLKNIVGLGSKCLILTLMDCSGQITIELSDLHETWEFVLSSSVGFVVQLSYLVPGVKSDELILKNTNETSIVLPMENSIGNSIRNFIRAQSTEKANHLSHQIYKVSLFGNNEETYSLERFLSFSSLGFFKVHCQIKGIFVKKPSIEASSELKDTLTILGCRYCRKSLLPDESGVYQCESCYFDTALNSSTTNELQRRYKDLEIHLASAEKHKDFVNNSDSITKCEMPSYAVQGLFGNISAENLFISTSDAHKKTILHPESHLRRILKSLNGSTGIATIFRESIKDSNGVQLSLSLKILSFSF